MFRFENPEYFYLLAAIPLLLGVYWLSVIALSKRRRRFADAPLLSLLAPGYSWKRFLLKTVLTLTALAFIVVMLARPQYGTVTHTGEGKGSEAAFLMDGSNSMLAQDVQPNRLERTKLLVSTLIDRMKNDKISLSVFAGEAYPQLPITNDYTSAKLFLDNFTPGMVTLQGTSLAAAINLGRKSFTDKEDIGKAIIVITDGEDHEEGALRAAEAAREEGYKLFILGVGSTRGANIPMPDGSNLRDNQGQEVITAVNVEACKEVAKAGGGEYIHVDNTDAAQTQLLSALNQLQHADNAASFTDRDEQFQAMAVIVLALLILEFFVFESKNPFWKRFRIFTK